MESNEGTGLSSYFPLHQPPPLTTTTASAPVTAAGPTTASPTNGIVPATNSSNPTSMVYPGSVPSAVSSPLETVKRKRGRPRKYGTPEQAAAAKRMNSASASASISQPKKKDQASSAGGGGESGGAYSSSKKSQLAALGNLGQGFTPHIINVAAGEDVGQKIMLFMQQSKREICILSASGSISNASLRQPATSGGSITYEGRFDILSLSGSYVRTDLGGRTGGLSVCLASTDGQIIGGGVGGPLTAAGPIQVIAGTFVMDSKKDAPGLKADASASKLASPISSTPVSGMGFRSDVGGSQFVMQPRGMQYTPQSTEWRGSTGHGMHQSPENGDFEHLAD